MYAGLVCCVEKKSVGCEPNSAGVRSVRVVASVTLGALGLTTSLPHCLQNFAPAISVAPQFGQVEFAIISVNITLLAFDYASTPSAAQLTQTLMPTEKTKMKNHARSLFTLLLTAASLFAHPAVININARTQEDAAAWVNLSPADDGFTALMPLAPVETSQQKKYDKINADVRLYTATTPQKTIYTIWALKTPSRFASALTADDINDYLDWCAELVWDDVLEPKLVFSQLGLGRYQMTYLRDLQSIVGVPAREYWMVLGPNHGVAHIYYSNRRAYIVMALEAPVDDLDKAKKFVNSFKVPPPPLKLNAEKPVPPPVAPSSRRVYSPRETTQKARLLSRPEPQYTNAARKFQVSGTVVLRAVFSSDGRVTNIRVFSGLPHGLTKAAIDAAREIKFQPAVKDGQPVSQYIQIEYNYNLY